MTHSFEIPVDNAIVRFHEHLQTHDRTILSARYGDGKTYFLHKIMADGKVKNNFRFLTIYPVNYQVEENRDIFELIKYDLLIQLFVKGIMEPDIQLTKAQALGWCLQLNAPSLAEGLLPVFSNLCLDANSAKIAAAFLTGKKTTGKFRQKVNELQESFRDRQITQFLKEISKNPTAGQDVITGIIQKGIADYKREHKDKELVLVIEDMDRMDPAHLFRILNVFSAHIDLNYRFGCETNEPYFGGKFGLDKVVFVMSYENTKKIYHHFYGQETDFEGYINKFCSSNYFPYSFEEEKENYFYERMAQNTKVDPMTIKLLVKPDFLKQHSVREVVNAIERLDDFIKPIEPFYQGEMLINVHHGALMIIAIMRRLGMKNEEIKERIVNCINDNKTYKLIFIYFVCFFAYVSKKRIFNNRVHYRSATPSGPNMFEITKVDDYGKAECAYYNDGTSHQDYNQEFKTLLDKLLGLVSA